MTHYDIAKWLTDELTAGAPTVADQLRVGLHLGAPFTEGERVSFGRDGPL